jgi:hypothetical protein
MQKDLSEREPTAQELLRLLVSLLNVVKMQGERADAISARLDVLSNHVHGKD